MTVSPFLHSQRLVTRRSLGMGLLAVALSACSDGTTSVSKSGPAALDVVSGNLQTGTVGNPLNSPLVVRVTSGSGALVSGVTVAFVVASGSATVSPASAVTDVFGEARTQVTLASTPGTVQVKASVSGSSLSTSFTITAVAQPSSNCTAGSSIAPTLGQIITLTTSPLCIAGGTSGGDYAIIAFNESSSATASASISLQPTGLDASTGVVQSGDIAATSRAAFSLSQWAGSSGRTRRDWQMPPADARLLASKIPVARAAYSSRSGGARFSVSATAAPAVGDIIQLNANSNDACSNVQKRAARVMAITNRAIIVADTANPTGGFTTADYTSFGATFDQYIDPTDRQNFGDVSDIDANGHVILFFTRAVNALTPKNANYYVGGFFFSRDLFPLTTAGGLEGCAGSNVGELFYLMVPDPNGVVNGNTFSKTFVTSATIAIVAHEYQHLINASRRIYVNPAATDFEETWLDEGLSHIAEELLFYARTSLAPKQDLDVPTLRASSTYVSVFNDDAIDNFGRIREYMSSPSKNSPYAHDDSLATRGATWSFLRWATDHNSASDQSTVWRALANNALIGMANLTSVYGSNLPQQFRNWAISLMTDNVSGVDAGHQMLSWDYRSILVALSQTSTYPLAPLSWTNGTATTTNLVGGGAAYMRFAVGATQTGSVAWPSIPANVTLTLARLR